jgi:TPR repeat protein
VPRSQALFHLGYMHGEGRGVRANATEASRILRKAIGLGRGELRSSAAPAFVYLCWLELRESALLRPIVSLLRSLREWAEDSAWGRMRLRDPSAEALARSFSASWKEHLLTAALAGLIAARMLLGARVDPARADADAGVQRERR